MGLNLFMKKIGVVVFIAILLLGFFITQQITKTEVRISGHVVSEIEKGDDIRVYLKLKDSAVGKRGIASDVKASITDTVDIKHEFKDKVSAIISSEELDELKNNPNIESIEIVGTRNILLQDSVPQINANDTWNSQLNGINLTGEHETICIIDTGINYSHPDLGGCFGEGCKVVAGYDYCADDINCTTSDSDPMGVHYHGTHVAGIVAASGSIKGVAPGANLVVIKAANATGTLWDDDLEKGIDWCVANASTYNISVISMSLGGGLYSSYCNDDPLNDSINNAIANNISVVIAAGNDGSTSQIAAPACHQNVTPVSNIQKDDSTFAGDNRNNLVLLIAPGISINSTVLSGYGPSSGTSMATPHVSGAIALINQFRRLEGSAVLTPSEVEDALNDSGFRINDSGGSNIFYSRIDILATLKEIDSSAPEITLNSPSHNALGSSENQTFNCSATDALQLSNVTFKLYNITGELFNETTESAINNTHELIVNLTLENGTYLWSCEGYDDKSNTNSSINYTLKIGAMALTINSPDNNEYTDSSSVDFNCSVEDSVSNLTNITFYLWNESGILIYNESENISGSSNTSVFNYTLEHERAYEWNCEAYDNDSNSVSESSNYTITYDNTNPVVTLVSPADNADEDDGSITFSYNVTDNNTIDNCSLLIEGTMEENDGSINRDETETMSTSLSAGSYDWVVKCRDDAGNIGTSASWEIDVTTSTNDDDDDDGSSSGNTGGTGGGTAFFITNADFEKGASKYMRTGDLMKFNSSGDDHQLRVDSYDEDSVTITLESDPISLTISVGETEKADLNKDNIYDIEVQYLEFINTLAKIQIKKITEAIPVRTIQEDTPVTIADNASGDAMGTGGITSEEVNASSFNLGGKITALWGRMGKTGHIILYIVLGAGVICALGVVVYFNKERILAKIPRINISLKKRRFSKKGL